MSFFHILSYAAGHFLNDQCASMWFTYLLLYFEKILLLPTATSSTLYLMGQIVDAASTPVLGYLIDRIQISHWYSKRKTWHVIGSVLVSVSWSVIFGDIADLTTTDIQVVTNESSSILHEDKFLDYYFILSNTSKNLYEAWSGKKFWILLSFISLGQIGWACTQISHLSMINVIGTDQTYRNRLNSIRFAGGIVANLIVYLLLFCLLHTSCSGDGVISPEDKIAFRIAIFVILVIGLLMNGVFHVFVKEQRYGQLEEEDSESFIQTEHDEEIENNSDTVEESQIYSETYNNENNYVFWLKYWRFWCVVVIYTLCRVVNNSLQVFLVLYVSSKELNLGKHYIAILPFVQYIFGFIAALLARFINKDKLVLGTGITSILIASILILFPEIIDLSIWTVVSMFALFGFGSSSLVCSSLGIISSLIGEQHQNMAAFVYSINSLFDKIATGVFVVIIKQWIQNGLLYSQFLSLGIPILSVIMIPFVLVIKV